MGATGKDRSDPERDAKRKADEELNRELEQTFPASDPPSVTRQPVEREFDPPPPDGKRGK